MSPIANSQQEINARPAHAERLGDLSGAEALRFQFAHLGRGSNYSDPAWHVPPWRRRLRGGPESRRVRPISVLKFGVCAGVSQFGPEKQRCYQNQKQPQNSLASTRSATAYQTY